MTDTPPRGGTDQRAALLATARALSTHGLNKGTAGNVSLRLPGGFLITPTGMAYEDCDPTDMVTMAMDGSPSRGRKPSSEWRFHRDIYAARADAGAVVHTHSAFATSLACLRRSIPPFHYMIARFGGADLRCARYATFGSQELSDAALEALEGRLACLLANHGMIVIGRDLAHALKLAVELETLCEHYWRAIQAGDPVILPPDEMARVLAKFAGYGQQ